MCPPDESRSSPAVYFLQTAAARQAAVAANVGSATRGRPIDAGSERTRHAMESKRFDNLIRRLASRPVTRATVLRGLATSGVGTLAGVSLLAEPDGAEGKKKRRRNRKKPVCNCTSALASSCSTQKLGKKARKRLLASNACAYRGRCTGVSGCAAPLGCNPSNNTQGSCLPGQICNLQAICVAGC